MNRLKAIWRLLNLTCQDMTHLASESLDRDLGRLERFVLRAHLLYCSACRRFLKQLALVHLAARKLVTQPESDLPVPVPGPDLPAEARDRIKRALKKN
jgi:predicted anti-sigma-YlaC factor YlaD